MVWISQHFNDAHLSAIRWLNEHTTDEFAFFAVRLRVVRIADSPMVPRFEVVEQPNLDFVQKLDTWRNRRTSCCGWPTEIFHCRG